jgi:PqqD family protein of HPr-rel-A system
MGVRVIALSSVTWRLNALVALHWRNWDDEWVVFDSGSGQTHKMDLLTAAVLTLVEAGATTEGELLSQLTQASDISGPEWLQAVQAAIGRLSDIGLIESEPR